jgi:hypothetical protein
MSPPHRLAGVHAAAVTPLAPDGTPDLEAVSALLDHLARRGCHGRCRRRTLTLRRTARSMC